MPAVEGEYRMMTTGWLPGRAAVSGLVIALCFGTNFPLASVDGRTIYIGMTEAMIAVCVALAVISGRSLKCWRLQPTHLSLALAASSVVILSSWIANVVIRPDYLSVAAAIEVVRWFVYVTALVVVPVLLLSHKDAAWVLGVAIVGISINAMAAIEQYATLNIYDRRAFGFLVNAFDREGGEGTNPNALGILLGMGACIAAGLWLKAGRHRKNALTIVVGLCGAGTAATVSRSAMLGTIAGLMVILLAERRQRVRAGVVALVGVTCITGIVWRSEYLRQRILSTLSLESGVAAADSVLERFEIWRLALGRWPEVFVIGAGYGGTMTFLGGRVVDSLFLESFIGTGIPGLFCVGWVGLEAYRLMRRTEESGFGLARGIGCGGKGMVVAIAVASLSGSVLLSPRVLGMSVVLTGVAVRLAGLRGSCGAGPSLGEKVSEQRRGSM